MKTMHAQNKQGLLRIAEAAALLGVSTKTLYRWEAAGALHPGRTPSGHRRYRREELLALKAQMAGRGVAS